MTVQEVVTKSVTHDEFVQRAREIVPVLRERARETEKARSVSPEVIAAAKDVGLFSMMVPKSFGGDGLGVGTLCAVLRELSHGDMSSAWAIGFLIEHNWMAARFPREGQDAFFADQNFMLAAAPLVPSGTAVKVDGGFEVSGTWRYASAYPNSDGAIVGAMLTDGDLDPEAWSFYLPSSDLTSLNDWYISGLSGTGSVSITADKAFVPDHFGVAFDVLFSFGSHEGAHHPERHMRQLLIVGLWAMFASYAMGGAERAVEMYRERLETVAYGQKRRDQALSRVRWATAHQRVRAIGLLFDELQDRVDSMPEGLLPLTEGGQILLDALTVIHESKEIIRLVADGAGSSAFSLENPMQRYLRDIDVLANHVASDYDNGMERASRWVLGFDAGPFDPFPTDRESTRRADTK